jgi:hypothetical protein
VGYSLINAELLRYYAQSGHEKDLQIHSAD